MFQHLRTRGAADCFAFHPANGGYRRPVEAAILKGLGVKSGVPDIIAIKAGKTYALELKKVGGKLSDSQSEVLDAMGRAGVQTGVAYGLAQAILCLEAWGLLRGTM